MLVPALLAACAAAPRGAAAPKPLTSVDTVYYEVPGRTRAEWARNLPGAAEAAGIRRGAVAYTAAHVMWRYTGEHTASNGCQLDGSVLQLRLGHVMPRLAAGASPSASEQGAWNVFVDGLWAKAHAREVIGARLADSLRGELKRSPTSTCAELIAVDRRKVSGFPARYMAAVMADEAARWGGGELP